MLALRGITKRFAGVTALDDVSLELAEGEVVAVIGENGAGKSTLMKIIGGVYQADAGTIELDGAPVTIRNPADALARGIRVIYQELSVLDNLTIAANIFLGREHRKVGLLDETSMVSASGVILKRLGLSLDPRRLVSTLSLAEQQLVEIARALSMEVRILILDEPTSSLTLEETQNLLRLVLDLKNQGVAILYVSHRLDEVHQVADRVVALKDGKPAGGLDHASISREAMIKLMVGRDLARRRDETICNPGAVRLRLRSMHTARYPNESVNLDISAGEIVCLAGLVGAGRSELARAAFGVDSFVGEVEVDGKIVHINSPHDAIEACVYLVPEDRRGAGLLVEMSVRENISLPDLPHLAKAGLIDRAKESSFAKTWSEKLRVKTETVETPVSNLSGGNQQKVVLARWLALNPKVLIFDEPTRGIDVGSKAEIYSDMRNLADSGVAILMISSDMEEVLGVSDRIAVLHEGRLTGILSRSEASEEGIMLLAVGGAA